MIKQSLFVFFVISTTVVFLLSSNTMIFAQDNDKELAEFHVKEAKSLEENARIFAIQGDNDSATKEFEKAAEQYSEAATYYRSLGDFFNAAEYNGRASIAHEEASIAHSNLRNFELEILHWFLSNEFKAKSLHQKGIFLFGEDYILPPKHQKFIVDDPHDIVCKHGLELIFKASDDSPACVKPTSISKLNERGWTSK